MNSIRKYVVSTTLDKVEWNTSVLIKGDLLEEIKELKQQDGRDIAVHGSARLSRMLMQQDLVDRLRLLVYPVVVGKGKRLFEEGAKARFKLVEGRPLSVGVLALIYAPDRG